MGTRGRAGRGAGLAAIGLALPLLVACGRDSPDAREGGQGPEPATTVESAATPAELEDAAREIVLFLRGEGRLSGGRLADTVTLYLSPEGGGGAEVLPREQLQDPVGWRIEAPDGYVHLLAPPPGATVLTARAGVHFNCLEYSLSTRSAELALLPHVGVKLEPAESASCLQTWNMTFVFDPEIDRPTLIAAVYDQWEW